MEEKNNSKQITFGTYAVIVTIFFLALLVSILIGVIVNQNKEKEEVTENQTKVEDVKNIVEINTSEESTEDIDPKSEFSNFKTVAEFVDKFPEYEQVEYELLDDEGNITFEQDSMSIVFNITRNVKAMEKEHPGEDLEIENSYEYLEIQSVEEVIDKEKIENELKLKYKKIGELENDGWSIDGYANIGDDVTLSLSHSEYSYSISVDVEQVEEFDKENYKETSSDYQIQNISIM